jgi:uncharacterized protein YbbC (DUF1343 family)
MERWAEGMKKHTADRRFLSHPGHPGHLNKLCLLPPLNCRQIVPGRVLSLLLLGLIFAALTRSSPAAATDERDFRLGVEVLRQSHAHLVRGKKAALLVGNPSYDQAGRHTIESLSTLCEITAVFTGDPWQRPVNAGPNGLSHDFACPAPLIEIIDPLKRPSPADIQPAELLIIDIPDIGIRYFQYVTLLAQFLDLARAANLPVLVLDRPNPISAECVSGPVLNVDFRSRFGVYPIPLVYGMTMGELALFFNKTFGIGARLTVVGMEGYHRAMRFSEAGLHWFPPSDHLPEAGSPAYYAVTGFLGEMGVFSTGVGTPRPFHYVLAPWINGTTLADRLNRYDFPGIRFRPIFQKPFYGLYQGKRVPGVELMISDPSGYDPVAVGIGILKVLYEIAPDRIPLENPTVAEGLDTLLGGDRVRNALINGVPLMQIVNEWQPKLREFRQTRRQFLLYPE